MKKIDKKKLIISTVVITLLAIFSLSGCIGFIQEVTTFGWSHTDDTGTAVSMCGKIVAPAVPANNYEGYIYYDTVNHGSDYNAYKYKCGPATPDRILKSFCCSADNLERTTTYYYIAVADNIITHKRLVSNPASFKPGTPRTSTIDYDYGIDWITIQGELVNLGGAPSCQVWFEYGISEHNLNQSTTKKTMTTKGEFSETLTDLDICQIYYFRAVVSNDVGTDYSFTEEATPGEPIVYTHVADNIGTNSATLQGKLNHLGGAQSCQVWFDYGTSKHDLNRHTTKKTMTSPGEFSDFITDLNSGSTYYFQAVADNGICPPVRGNIRDFETE